MLGNAKDHPDEQPCEQTHPEDQQKYFIVDHRFAQSQVRYSLLISIALGYKSLQEIAERSGLSTQYLWSVCIGHGGVPYRELAQIAMGMYGAELLVTVPWTECRQSTPENNTCQADEECVELLERAYREGKLPKERP